MPPDVAAEALGFSAPAPEAEALTFTPPPYDVKAQGDRRAPKGRGRRVLDDPNSLPLDPLEAKTREDARRRLMEVKQQIQQRSAEMLLAEPSQVPRLAQELQRLRVAMLMLREIVEDVADPNAYRELSLLNKMMTGHDPEQDALRREQEMAESEAVARLSRVGLTAERAGGMVRVLESLGHLMNRRPDDDGDDSPPTPPVS